MENSPGEGRENLGSRLGFILLTAGCAIGLGNIWRFPFIAGKYGGAVFVLVYLLFLLLMGFPIMVMELAIGRASRRTLYGACKVLPENRRFRWHVPGGILFAGSGILMIFYTTVTGWMLAYAWDYLVGPLSRLDADGVRIFFGDFLASPFQNVFWMLLTVIAASVVCGVGLQRGVERITKLLMAGLFLLLIGLCFQALTLPGAAAGLDFYWKPDFNSLREIGLAEIVIAAMGQAFFTLSIGIGSVLVFGSYIDRNHSLAKESLVIIGLDTMVALLAGVIIFPACFSYGVEVNSGPGLVFVSLPNVFNHMPGGRWWGLVFFLFMSAAALTTVVAVFENLIAFMIDEWKFTRSGAALLNGCLIGVFSLPCALGFNWLKGIQPLGEGSSILDFEDYLVSDNLLPLGGLFMILFCLLPAGWGWKNFLREANSGRGLRFPAWSKYYLATLLPLMIIFLFAVGFYRRWRQ